MRSSAGRVLAVLVLLVLVWQVWLWWQARGKIPPDLQAQTTQQATVDVMVTLRFPPERFHILIFQRFGRVVGTEGRTVEVRGVSSQRLREIARFYWVERIAPAAGDGG
jgi:hypothetical protein